VSLNLEAERPSPGADRPRAGAQSMRMKLIGFRAIVAALLLPAIVARTAALALAPQVGETYEITLTKDSAYQESYARGSGTLARKAGGLDSTIFSVEMPVDPDAFRRARAEADVVVGEVMKKPVSLEAALSRRATETISGTISIAFQTDSVGHVRRRTKVTKLDIKGPDGPSETQTVTETLERRLISRHD
jgi:hypothetical protein